MQILVVFLYKNNNIYNNIKKNKPNQGCEKLAQKTRKY